MPVVRSESKFLDFIAILLILAVHSFAVKNLHCNGYPSVTIFAQIILQIVHPSLMT